jgi:hypothetical protein
MNIALMFEGGTFRVMDQTTSVNVGAPTVKIASINAHGLDFWGVMAVV